MEHDYAFEMAASAVRFGAGVTREVGADLRDWKAQRVLVLTDPTLSRLKPVHTVLESLDAHGIHYTLFDRVRVEPTDESVLEAIAFANQHAVRRAGRGRRRVHHRHRQGGEPLHHAIHPPTSSTTSIRRSARACRCPARSSR